jgi:hypothetical protein
LRALDQDRRGIDLQIHDRPAGLTTANRRHLSVVPDKRAAPQLSAGRST